MSISCPNSHEQGGSEMVKQAYGQYEKYLRLLSMPAHEQKNGFIGFITNLVVKTPWLVGIGRESLSGSQQTTGFEVIQMTDGSRGTAGPAGNFFLRVGERQIPKVEDGDNKKYAGLQEQLRNLFKAASKYKNVKMVPKLDYPYQDTEFPTRQSDNPIVRLVFPGEGGESMFVDYPLSQVIGDKFNLLSKILTDGKRGDGIKMLSQWYEQKEGEEPPWLVVSAGSSDDRHLPWRDPRIWGSFHFELDFSGNVVGVETEWGHTGADGGSTTQVLTEMGYIRPEGKEKEVKFDPDQIPQTLTGLADDIESKLMMEPVMTRPEMGDKEEINRLSDDPLSRELMATLGMVEIDAAVAIDPAVYRYLSSWGKIGFEKPSNFWALTVALVSGQAPLIPVASKEESRGLQVMLGLWGREIVEVMRQALYKMRGNEKEDQTIQIAADFWGKWQKLDANAQFKEQLDLAQKGAGLVTQMAHDVGAGLRGSLQKIAESLAGDVAEQLNTRWMISTLKGSQFMTAISGSSGRVVGLSEQAITLRSAIKDPIFTEEAIIRLVETDRTVATDLLGVISTVDKGFGLDQKILDNVQKWLKDIQGYTGSGVAVKEVKIDGDLTAIGLLRHVGDDVKTRERSVEFARVFAALAVTILKDKNTSTQNLRRKIPQMLGEMAKNKLGWILEFGLELSALAAYKQGNLQVAQTLLANAKKIREGIQHERTGVAVGMLYNQV